MAGLLKSHANDTHSPKLAGVTLTGLPANDEKGPRDFLIIIGAMKSGTTTLFSLLSQHPEVACSREKEPGFFAVDGTYARGMSWYRSLWEWDEGKHQVALEASTGYTKFPFEPHVPERMVAQDGCRFRFIYIMRQPFERIESHVRHGLFNGWNESLDAGLRSDGYIMEVSRYAKQIDEYLAHFSSEGMLLLTLEALRKDTPNTLRSICAFAGLDDTFVFEDTDQIANPGTQYEGPGPIRRQSTSVLERRNGDLGRAEFGRYRLTEKERRLVLVHLQEDLWRLWLDHDIDVKENWNIDVRQKKTSCTVC